MFVSEPSCYQFFLALNENFEEINLFIACSALQWFLEVKSTQVFALYFEFLRQFISSVAPVP